MTSRPAQSHMLAALAEAEAAAARGEVPVGAVVVGADGSVLARAGNRTRELADPTAHAEMLAIRQACAALGSERLDGADSTSRSSPARCARRRSRLPASAGSTSAPADPKGGGVEHGPRIFTQPTCHHAPEVYGGIEEMRAARAAAGFFRAPPLRARLAALAFSRDQLRGAADRHQPVPLVELLQRRPSP